MNPRSTVLLFVIATLMGVAIYLFERGGAPAGDELGGRGERLFSGLDAAGISAIELDTEDGVRARVVRRADRWWLEAPLAFPADATVVDALANALAQIDIEGRVKGEAALDDFGLGDEALEVAFEVDGERLGLYIGGRTPVGANTYVRRLDDGQIFYLQSWRTNALRKSLLDLRDRRVVEFDQATLTNLEIRWPGQQLDFERREGVWWLTSPVLEPADETVLSNLLSDLAFLRAEGFVDEPDSATLALLGAPLFQLLIGEDAAGAPPTGLTLGGPSKGMLLARGSDGVIHRVALERVDDFPRELFAYRSKHIGAFDVTRARRFQLIYRDLSTQPDAREAQTAVVGELVAGEWQVPTHPMSPDRAAAMIEGLARLDANGIIADGLGEDALAELRLAPPRVSIRVEDEQGEALMAFGLGRRHGDRGFMVMRDDSPVIYRVGPEVADLVPLSVSALETAFSSIEDPSVEVENADGIAADARRVDRLDSAFEE